MFALRAVPRPRDTIVAFDVIAFSALVIVVVDLAINLTLRVPWWLFRHGFGFRKCQQGT